MSKEVVNINGGVSTDQATFRPLTKFLNGEVITGLSVVQNSPLGMSVLVQAGNGQILVGSGATQYGRWFSITADEVVTITTANGSNPRIDTIVAYYNTGTTPVGDDNPNMITFVAVAGTPAASPTAPSGANIVTAIGAGKPYIILGDVLVGTSVTQITTTNVTDRRTMISPLPVVNTGWLSLLTQPTAIADNGNGSYNLTWASSILSTRSVGYRNKYVRTVTAPTQCTSLNGTTQYYSKTSPGGMTFTDDFVVSAWVKLNAYNSAANQVIASRYNGTSGWSFRITAAGNIALFGLNAGAANNSFVQSYTSIPTGRWVHVAAQLDMSAFTATTTTSYIMIDGADVPANIQRGGTNPTALVQAGNLEIGSNNGGTEPFNGKIAQVAIYSAKVTQATVKASRDQTLSPTATNLISGYTFNNSLNDINTTNANNLTANGSAVATNADSPFAGGPQQYTTAGTTEYSITTFISSDGLTETVQVPEGYALPTTGGVSSVAYSAHKTPYGFDASEAKWVINMLVLASINSSPTSSTTVNTFQGINLLVGAGSWDVIGDMLTFHNPTSSVHDYFYGLSTSTSTFSDPELAERYYQNGLAVGAVHGHKSRMGKRITVTSQTAIYPLIYSSVTLSTVMTLSGSIGSAIHSFSKISAKCAYL